MEIAYRVNAPLQNAELSALYSASWPQHNPAHDFAPELAHALAVIAAYDGNRLIGFVRVAWDGAMHAFLLEPTVHPDYRRRGIGRTLVERAVDEARERGMVWIHVDYEPELHPFYEACGFRPTMAGLVRLR